MAMTLGGGFDSKDDFGDVEEYKKKQIDGGKERQQAQPQKKSQGAQKDGDQSWQAETKDGEQTLADIKRKVRAEANERLEEMEQNKRFKITNFTSEDSNLTDEKKLFSFYCSICGLLSAVSDTSVLKLPRRSTDKAHALQETLHFHKKYANYGERILLKRPGGVEVQYRFYCKGCKQPLGYRPFPPEETSTYSYFLPEALVAEQSQSTAFKKA